MTICDTIKQNESELESNENWVFHSNVCFIVRALFWWKPHQNWTSHPRDIAILVMPKTTKYKRNWILLLAISFKSITASSNSFCLITSHMCLICERISLIFVVNYFVISKRIMYIILFPTAPPNLLTKLMTAILTRRCFRKRTLRHPFGSSLDSVRIPTKEWSWSHCTRTSRRVASATKTYWAQDVSGFYAVLYSVLFIHRFKGILCDFFIFTLEQVIVLNKYCIYNKPIPKIWHVQTLQTLFKMRYKKTPIRK